MHTTLLDMISKLEGAALLVKDVIRASLWPARADDVRIVT
jgi:hypothetical protein